MVKNNKKILILEGGFNEEHEVSLNTSGEVKKILEKNKFNFTSLIVNPKTFENDIKKFKDHICFNALHGPFGEDGKIQKILNKNNVKYTHSGIKSSSDCFNKIRSKKILNKNNILTPKYDKLEVKDLNKEKLYYLKTKFKKFVLKPNESGSSFAVKIIKNQSDLNIFIKKLKNFKKILGKHKTLIIEEYIEGKELTVSTIKLYKKIKSIAVTEIKPKNKFFDYKSKYSKGFSKHILPANIDTQNYKKCLKIAKKIHKILRCNSISRSDFIFNLNQNKIYFLEINTQPGLTPLSLLPEQAKYSNISFEKIILNIIKNIN